MTVPVAARTVGGGLHNGLTDRGEDEEGLPAGWHEFFERLDDHLDGVTRTANQHADRWQALKPLYRMQMDAVVRASGETGATPAR